MATLTAGQTAPYPLRLIASAVILAGVALVAFGAEISGGQASHHMVLHIALMNLIAPGIVLLTPRRMNPFRRGRRPAIWIAAAVQLIFFLFWHAPPGMAHSSMAVVAMYLTLLAPALWFWSEIINWSWKLPWMAIGALAVTGKIICLVAALYVFAPRTLYAGMMEGGLADQQLAGVLMLAACPLAYLGAVLRIAVAALDRQFARAAVRTGDAA